MNWFCCSDKKNDSIEWDINQTIQWMDGNQAISLQINKIKKKSETNE